jgi:phage gpG-like protein
MALSINITVTDNATPFLQQLDDNLREQVGQDMALAIAKIIYDQAVETCPSPTSTYYPTDSTGNLRDSHSYGPQGEGAFVIADADYATAVHEGHAVVGGRFTTRIKGGTSEGMSSYAFIPARPWMTMAIEMASSDITQAINDIISQAIEDASSAGTDVSGT